MTGLPGAEAGRLRTCEALGRRPLADALAALNDGDVETRVVGGAVRDLALGLEPEDFDLATTALPSETIRRAEAAGFKVAPTGIDHGTVTLIMLGRTIETTTLREDVETDGRRARVVFGRDFLADARRRDFTINALSLDAEGRIFDPLGGLEDLAAGRVRFIGDADARIGEDHLRILRFFRFSARFGRGALDPHGLSAAIRNRASLARLSRERVRAEVLKLLVAPHVPEVVRAMGEAGILAECLGFSAPDRLARAVAIDTAPDGLLRLAALAVFVEEDSERLRERLRLSNGEGERLRRAAAALAPLHGLTVAPSTDALRRLLFRAGRRGASDALLLAHVESGAAADDPDFARAHRFLAEAPAPKSPVSGKSIVARGAAAGRRVGEILRTFDALWEDAGFPTDKATIDRLVTAAEAPGRAR
ncbi:tRNA nucleotidyltransferase/poly(A) polymerase [Roseiarcus fermentans]|uniref:tRNA nucleotidyltransferase/poly(A) polymerase n=1 Tax=Roseiarcus fermentans TaxID=1473586 RepID=A0A366F1W6_9HYPH|nr:CCA tRNA nucleotidyltransferase [Roseiarcus fermentans]RBP08631.1 tRNA nucleotidyltransferase/poly(A) polymerase [Roseiarcus fermentans]